MNIKKEYETVIGLEVHVELATKTKIFCACSTKFGGEVNAHTCPVCSGMPGSLPVLNRQVVEYALMVGLAVNCDINKYSRFDRKNYFYPDNPQNYQISQLYMPICHDGKISIQAKDDDGNDYEKYIGIHEIHMEEDAGKLIHDEVTGSTLVDYNRAGVPLIEIVTEPDMRSADEVIAFLEKLRLIIQYLGASDCKLQEGSMRADVNVSVRAAGAPLGTRTEMKNLNSFKAIRRAIDSEAKRQWELLQQGEDVLQETRRWDDDKEISYTMRSKEDAKDYRYFPEPDLMPLVISEDWISEVRSKIPMLRDEKIKLYTEVYKLSEYDANLLTSSKHMADMFEATINAYNNPKEIANWYMVEAMRLLKEAGAEAEAMTFAPENLARLVKMVDEGSINRTIAKEVFVEIFKNNVEPDKYVKDHGLGMVSDETYLQQVVDKVLEENPQSVADYKAGKTRAMGYVVGQVMRMMKGKAEPSAVNRLVKESLEK